MDFSLGQFLQPLNIVLLENIGTLPFRVSHVMVWGFLNVIVVLTQLLVNMVALVNKVALPLRFVLAQHRLQNVLTVRVDLITIVVMRVLVYLKARIQVRGLGLVRVQVAAVMTLAPKQNPYPQLMVLVLRLTTLVTLGLQRVTSRLQIIGIGRVLVKMGGQMLLVQK